MNYNIVIAIDDNGRGHLIEILNENEFSKEEKEEIYNDLKEWRFSKIKSGLYAVDCYFDTMDDLGFMFDELEPIFTVEEWRRKA
jgi:hypothetical protein